MWEQVASLLGGNVMKELKEIVQTFKMPPEEAAKMEMAIKQFELNFQAKILELQVQDMNSARQREIQVRDSTPKILAYCVTGLFGSVLFYMMSYDLPEGSERVIDVMLGSLGTAWLMSMSYYFGSSMGSDAKTKLMDRFFGFGKKGEA